MRDGMVFQSAKKDNVNLPDCNRMSKRMNQRQTQLGGRPLDTFVVLVYTERVVTQWSSILLRIEEPP